MEYNDVNGVYTAVKWNDKTQDFEITQVSIERHERYPHKIVIKDLRNPSKQAMYAYFNNLKIDQPSTRNWAYIKDMTVDEMKDAILECKRDQVCRYYAEYIKHKNMLDIMEMRRNQ